MYGLSARQNVALSDQELEDKVREVLREFPNAGYRRVISQLSVNGFRPAQLRVREAMQRAVSYTHLTLPTSDLV